ncbi:MAG: hypothetical protein AB4041_14710 [Microcystaceae cyanobacterium]
MAIIGGGTAIVSVMDFEGKKCAAINTNLGTKLDCNNILISGILTPFFLLILAAIIALILKNIFKKFLS